MMRCQAELLKTLKDMSDVEQNDLDVTPVRDRGFNGQYSLNTFFHIHSVVFWLLRFEGASDRYGMV